MKQHTLAHSKNFVEKQNAKINLGLTFGAMVKTSVRILASHVSVPGFESWS